MQFSVQQVLLVDFWSSYFVVMCVNLVQIDTVLHVTPYLYHKNAEIETLIAIDDPLYPKLHRSRRCPGKVFSKC